MDNLENAIEIKNVSKDFRVFKDRPKTIKEQILNLCSNEYTPFHALKNVNLSIKKGESIALIGHNGCGKSTLLSIIAGILYPTSGTVKVNGRLSCLISLGAGFHPDFTGRENIYTNAAIFGLSKKETEENLDSIIEFSELGSFVDNPVRTYSSGMYLKLAFSVAIHINPEILLIDEILAVGDSNFQRKCFAKMQEFRRKGVTIVLVSHALPRVVEFCDRCLWLQDGVIRADGKPDEVTEEYLSFMNGIQSKNNEDVSAYANDAEISGLTAVNSKGEEIKDTALQPFSDLSVTAEIEKKESDGELILSISIINSSDTTATSAETEPIALKAGEKRKITLDIRSIPLNIGNYTIKASVRNALGKESCPSKEYPIKIESSRKAQGAFLLDGEWRH